MQQKFNEFKANKGVVKAIQEFEQIIQNKKSDIVWLAYYKDQIFQKFRERERFASDMVLKFQVSKSTLVFKAALKKLINDFPKIQKSSLSLQYFFEKIKIDQGNMQRKR